MKTFHYQCLAGKTAEERESRNGHGRNQEAACGNRHFLPKTAQLCDLAGSGGFHNGSGTHQQHAFKEYIGYRMGGCTVDADFTSNAQRRHHHTQLTDDMIRQEPANIVLQKCHAGRKNGHKSTDVDQHMGSGEESNQRINRRLGGIGSQIYRTRNGRLRVGIRNPSVKRRNSRIDADADENQPERRSVHISGQIGQTDSVMENLYQNSGQQHVSSEGMHQNVSERRPGRTPAVPGVYDVRGCEGRNLPEYNEADQIPGEYDAHITPRIDAGDSRFPFVLKIHGIDGIDHADAHEDHQEYHGHTVGIDQLECQIIGDLIGQRAVTVHHPKCTEGTH